MLRGGIYYTGSEQSFLQVDVLKAGNICNCPCLRDFKKGQIVTARRQGPSISKSAGLVVCPSVQRLVPTKSDPRKDNRWAADRVTDAFGE